MKSLTMPVNGASNERQNYTSGVGGWDTWIERAKFRWKRNSQIVDPEMNTKYILSFTIEKHVVKRIAAQLSSSIKTISKSRKWNCLVIYNKRCEDKKISKEKWLAFWWKWLMLMESRRGDLLTNSQCQYHTFTLFLVTIITVANMDWVFIQCHVLSI